MENMLLLAGKDDCKRPKQGLIFYSVLIWLCHHAIAYTTVTTPSSVSRKSQSSSMHPRIQQMDSAVDIPTSTSSRPASAPAISNSLRLTREEESELLRQAVEMRRLKALEIEMVNQPTSRAAGAPTLSSIKAKAAGYGDDWEAYQNAIYQGQRAREKLVTRNMGLVHFCVNDIIGKGKFNGQRRLNSLSREDLVQEGAIGLARAVDKWNPAIGGKFSTYAVYWIRAAILRCIAERDDLLRVPEHVSVAVRKMSAAARRLGMDIDEENLLASVHSSSSDESWKEAQAAKVLAEEAGLTNGQLLQALKARDRRTGGGYIAFEEWMQKGKDIISVMDGAGLEQMATTSSSLDMDHLVNTLSTYLRPKEMEALCWRYGLFSDRQQPETSTPQTKQHQRNYLAEAELELFGDVTPTNEIYKGGRWGEAMSFNEVGKQMKVSAEYGRKLCNAALDKLRRAADEGRLEPALLML